MTAMERVLFKNGLIFDGHSPDLLADRSILVADGVVEAISITPLDGPIDQVVDLKGQVLLPGLIDAHFHAYAVDTDFARLEAMPATYLGNRGAALMSQALRRGFTTVRDVGGADYGLWRAIEEGYVAGPRLFYCGRAFSQTGGHGDSRSAGQVDEPCGCSSRAVLADVLDGPDALRRAAREALRQGAHHLKMFLSGGISSPTDPIWASQFADEEIAAVVDEAGRRRAYVAAHAYGAQSIARAVRLGVRSIEHANLIDAETAGIVAHHKAYVVPTLATYDSLWRSGQATGAPDFLMGKLEDVRSRGLEAIEICRAAHVSLGFGTDLLGDLHEDQLEEFRLRSEVETPLQVLTAATSTNAEILQMTGKIGCIAPGAFADFVVVDGNPLEDLSVLYRKPSGITAVWKGGRRVDGVGLQE
jgi:imidazolonepropionase-like amidohydrolase